MVKRKTYLSELLSWKDEKVIKVVTGMRRSGKSTLLAQFQELLREQGVMASQIISVNLEDLEYEELLDYKRLYTFITERLDDERQNYIFLDEVQRVEHYEKVVDSLYLKNNTDIYITGSNSYMLSGDLATLLTGRYVEIKMLPFSFREFCEATGKESDAAFSEYLKIGGMPYAVTMANSPEKLNTYLEGIYNTVIIKDIEERQSRKEKDPAKRKISDIALLKNISRYLAGVVGNPVTVRSVTNYLVSGGRQVSPNTVDDYIDALCDAFIFYKAERFDIVGKELLVSNLKLYIADLGLRNHIVPKRNYDLGFSLENTVYFELMRRGYQVNVGKIGNAEVDFVARKNDITVYYQVTADMTSEQTFEREIRALRNINDNYDKVVLTLDRFSGGNYDGIEVVNIIDWLSDDNV